MLIFYESIFEISCNSPPRQLWIPTGLSRLELSFKENRSGKNHSKKARVEEVGLKPSAKVPREKPLCDCLQ
jgi:hypothetical protein